MRVFMRSWHSSQHIFFSRFSSRARVCNTATQVSSHVPNATLVLFCVEQALSTPVMVLFDECSWVFDR